MSEGKYTPNSLFAAQIVDPWATAPSGGDSEPDATLANQWVTIRNTNPAQSCDYRRLPAGIGPVDVPIGTCFPNRDSASPVHNMTQAGIAGTYTTGCSAICLNGGYADDFDIGFRIIYTGSSGAETGMRISATQQMNLNTDQKWSDGNKALRTSMAKTWPIRVLRGPKCSIDWAPEQGYRYDGLYMVRKCWIERGITGVKIIRFALERLHDQGPLRINGNVIDAPDYNNDEDYIGDWPLLDDDEEVNRQVKAREDFDLVDPRNIFIKEKQAELKPRDRMTAAELEERKRKRLARTQRSQRDSSAQTDSVSPPPTTRSRRDSPEAPRSSGTRSPDSSFRSERMSRVARPAKRSSFRSRPRSRSGSPELPVAKPKPLDRFARARQF